MHAKYLKEQCKEVGERLIPIVSISRIKSNRHKLKQRRFHLNVGKDYCTQYLHTLPIGLVESLEIFETC